MSALPPTSCSFRLAHAHNVLREIEERASWAAEASAAAEKQRGEMAAALENERKSVKATMELQPQQVLYVL